MAHTYTVARITDRFCYVQYSNPNEYGTPRPITAVFSVVPEAESIGVILHMVRCVGDRDGDYQAKERIVLYYIVDRVSGCVFGIIFPIPCTTPQHGHPANRTK